MKHSLRLGQVYSFRNLLALQLAMCSLHLNSTICTARVPSAQREVLPYRCSSQLLWATWVQALMRDQEPRMGIFLLTDLMGTELLRRERGTRRSSDERLCNAATSATQHKHPSERSVSSKAGTGLQGGSEAIRNWKEPSSSGTCDVNTAGLCCTIAFRIQLFVICSKRNSICWPALCRDQHHLLLCPTPRKANLIHSQYLHRTCVFWSKRNPVESSR